MIDKECQNDSLIEQKIQHLGILKYVRLDLHVQITYSLYPPQEERF